MITKPNKLDQYKKLLAAAIDGKLGAGKGSACMYSMGKRNCAVGFMFTPTQIEDIKARRLNRANVMELSDKIGGKNIETVTGFPIRELQSLQNLHDCSVDTLKDKRKEQREDSDFVRELQRRIAKGAKK